MTHDLVDLEYRYVDLYMAANHDIEPRSFPFDTVEEALEVIAELEASLGIA